MSYKVDEKGFALLTVLLIGTISMVLISVLIFVLIQHTSSSGKEKAYTSELEAAKGASEFIMASLREDSLTCNSGAACATSDAIDLHGAICTAVGKTGCSGLSATYLSDITHSPGAGLPDMTVVAVQVVSENTTGPEQAIVEFVYKVY